MDSGPATSVEPAGPTSPPPPVPEGWLPQYDPSSQEYYYVHRSTNHSQWETPTHSLPTPTTTLHDPAQSRLPAPSNEHTQAAATDADSQDGAEGSRGLFSKNKIQESYYDQNEIHEPYYDQYEHHQEDFPSKYGGTHHASETSALSQAVAPAQTSRLASGMGQLAQSLLGRVANSVLDSKLSGQQGQHQQQSHNMAVQGMHQPGSHSLLHSLLGSNTTQVRQIEASCQQPCVSGRALNRHAEFATSSRIRTQRSTNCVYGRPATTPGACPTPCPRPIRGTTTTDSATPGSSAKPKACKPGGIWTRGPVTAVF